MQIYKGFNKKLLAILTFFCLISIVLILPGPNSTQTIVRSELAGEPRDGTGEEPVLPHLTVDTWVYPTQIYKQEDTRVPNSADIILTVAGAGDPVTHGEGPATADIVFVVDTTGSMSGEISQIQSDIQEIVRDIKVNISNVKFGLGSYRDHPGSYSICSHYSNSYGASGDWPFKIEQDLTTDNTAFQSAVNGLNRGGGSDGPESVADTIYLTTHNFTWRGGDVAKVALLMGDAEAHNCDNTFGKWGNYSCTGMCPNGYVYKNVVADSATNKVIWATIGMGGTESNNSVGRAQWNYLCEKTGGKFRALGAEDLTELIVELIGNVVPTIRIAGKDAVVKMEVPDYISIVDGSLDPPPSSIIGGKTYTWDFGTIGIEQRFSVKYEIQATESGLEKLVYKLPVTRLEYLAWNGTEFNLPTTLVFPNATLDVMKSPWELNPPVSSILHPMNNKLYALLDSISGEAMDPDVGTIMEKVEISIMRFNDKSYWDGSGWTSVETWLTANGTTEWEYDSNSVIWNSNTLYVIQSRATDEDLNVEIPGEGVIFLMDLDAPWSYIEFPSDNSFVNSIPAITGSSTDTGGAGVEFIELSILLKEDQVYWTGNKWNTDETWLGTQIITTRESSEPEATYWSFDASQVNWVTDKYYIVRARATDKVGNLEPSREGVTFMYDDVPPDCTIIINDDNPYTTSPNVELSLSAQDSGSGVTLMAFNEEMNDTTWTSWEDFVNYTPFTLSTGDGEKNVYFKVVDRAGNIIFPIFDTIILDTKPPENVSIIINYGAKYTNKIDVVLSLYATDATSGLGNMSFSFDKLTWTDLKPFKFMNYLYLPQHDGERKVYLKVNDKAGNVAEPVRDIIILDTTPPEYMSIFINNGSWETNSTDVNLSLSAYDELSGVDQMSFSIKGNNWTSWEPFNVEKNFTFLSGDGEKIVYFRAKDLVGNVADPVNATIILNTTVPKEQVIKPKTHTSSDFNWLYLLILLLIILTLIAFAYLRKRKRRQFRKLSPPPTATTGTQLTGPQILAPIHGSSPQLAMPISATVPAAAISTPKLATPLMPGQIPVTQMPPVAKTMQLPPARIQK